MQLSRDSDMVDRHRKSGRVTRSTRKRRVSRRGFLACLAAAVVFPWFQPKTTAFAQAADIDELKAAFLFQFLIYVTWPDDAFEDTSSPAAVCVTDNDKIHRNLTTSMKGRKVGNRTITVLEHDEDDASQNCHLLFIGSGDSDTVRDRLARIDSEHVLTVGDSEDFLRDGGMIRLYVKQARLRIEINRKAAEEAGLKISSKLLGVVTIYEE